MIADISEHGFLGGLVIEAENSLSAPVTTVQIIHKRREQRPLERGAGQKGAAADGAARQGQNFGLASAVGILDAPLQLPRRDGLNGQTGQPVGLFVKPLRQQAAQSRQKFLKPYCMMGLR